MLDFIFWAAFGAAIGWVAVILRDEKIPRSAALYVACGGLGGLGGGLFGGLLAPGDTDYRVIANGIFFAAFGAVAFILCTIGVMQKLPRRHS